MMSLGYMPSIGIGQVSASFKINYIGIGLVSKKWYWCITRYSMMAFTVTV